MSGDIILRGIKATCCLTKTDQFSIQNSMYVEVRPSGRIFSYCILYGLLVGPWSSA